MMDLKAEGISLREFAHKYALLIETMTEWLNEPDI